MTATYIVSTTINPGVQYEVSRAEYEQLLELGILLNGPAEPVDPGVFDAEMTGVLSDVNSQFRQAHDELPPKAHTHPAAEISDSGSVGRALLATTATLEARTVIGAAATEHEHTASQISDSTTTGRSVLTATDAATARAAIGAGTSNLTLGTTAGTAKAGDYAPPAASDTTPGVVELATTAEATTGTDTVRAVTPAGLKTVADTKVPALTSVNSQAGTAYTLVLADGGKLVETTSGSAVALTVPPNSTAAFPVGTVITVRQYGAGQVTLTPGAGVTIRSRGARLKLAGQYAEATLRKRATDEWVTAGDLTV